MPVFSKQLCEELEDANISQRPTNDELKNTLDMSFLKKAKQNH